MISVSIRNTIYYKNCSFQSYDNTHIIRYSTVLFQFYDGAQFINKIIELKKIKWDGITLALYLYRNFTCILFARTSHCQHLSQLYIVHVGTISYAVDNKVN